MGKSSARKKMRKMQPVAASGQVPAPDGAVFLHPVRGNNRKWYTLLAAALLLSLLCYANSLNNDFVFDDPLVITDNPGIRGIENIPGLLGLTSGWTAYRPVRMASYALDYTLNKMVWRRAGGYEGADEGYNPFGYHVSNIALHVMTSLLVFLVVLRLAGNGRIAFLAAGLFALHPVHTDSVTYLSGRRDILFTLFYLAGFYFFLRYRQGRNILLMAASFGAYVLSMGSKEMGVTLPALFLCYDLVRNFSAQGKGFKSYAGNLSDSFKKSVAQSAYLYISLFVAAVAYSYYKVAVASPSHQQAYYGDSPFITFLTVSRILVRYMQLLVYPVNLIADYSYNAFPLAVSLFEPSTLFSFLLLAGAMYAILRLLSAYKLMAFGGIWFFLTLLPVCHVFPHHELLAEHYLYLPSVGFCLVAAVLCDTFMEDRRCRLYIYTCCLVIAILFLLRIVDRNRDWLNSLTLYEKTVKSVPECARANSNLCEAYTNAGRHDEALSACKKALIIDPNHIQANNNIGTVYARKGMLDEAIRSFRKTLVLRPRYAKGHFNLGLLFYRKGDLESAVYEFKEALSISPPNYAEVCSNLGIAYSAMGKFDEAVTQYKRALDINPFYAGVYFNLGVIYANRGEFEKAINEYKRALALKPQDTAALNNLAVAYIQIGEIDKAIAELQKAVAGNPDSGDAYFNLGFAYAKRGDFNSAINEYRQALAKGLAKADLNSNLGNIYLHLGMVDEAINEYRQALALQEDFAGAHNNLAMAYFRKKEYALAIKHADRAAALGLNIDPAFLKDLLPHR